MKEPLGQSDIVEALVKDPCDPPKLVVLKGFSGAGPPAADGKTQRWRIYLDHALTSYYEIEDKAKILHWEKLQDPAEGYRFWVEHGAKVRIVRTRADTADVPPLLSGRIAEANLPGPPVGSERWVQIPGGYAPGPGGPWSPWEDPSGPQWSVCRVGCASASP